MKLHLPLSLRSSLLACMALVGITVCAASAAEAQTYSGSGDAAYSPAVRYDVRADEDGEWIPGAEQMAEPEELMNPGGLAGIPGEESKNYELSWDAENVTNLRKWLWDESEGEEGRAVGGTLRGEAYDPDAGALGITGGRYTGDIYARIEGGIGNGGMMAFYKGGTNSADNGVLTGNGYVFFNQSALSGKLGTVFGTYNAGEGGIDGNLYMEFSGAGGFTVAGQSDVSAVSNLSVGGVYNSRKGITGEFRVVINSGIFEGKIVGGAVAAANAPHGGTVAFYLNGGSFNDDIYAGGMFGSVDSTCIVITGDAARFSDSITISAGGMNDSEEGSVVREARVVLSHVTSGESGIGSFVGTISGGWKAEPIEETPEDAPEEGEPMPAALEDEPEESPAVWRTLEFVASTLERVNADIVNFDAITLSEGSEITLSDLYGVSEVSVSDSVLNLQEVEYELNVLNNAGTVTLGDGVKLVVNGTTLPATTPTQKGVYVLGEEASLTLGREVSGNYEVEMLNKGSMVSQGSGEYVVALGGGSSLAVTGGSGQYSVKAADAGNSVSVSGISGGAYTISMGDDSTLTVGKKVTIEFAKEVKLGAGSKMSLGEATTTAASVTMGDRSSLTAGKDAKGTYGTVSLGDESSVILGDGATTAMGSLVMGNQSSVTVGDGASNTMTSVVMGDMSSLTVGKNSKGEYSVEMGAGSSMRLGEEAHNVNTVVVTMGDNGTLEIGDRASGRYRVQQGEGSSMSLGQGADSAVLLEAGDKSALTVAQDATGSYNVTLGAESKVDIAGGTSGEYAVKLGKGSALHADATAQGVYEVAVSGGGVISLAGPEISGVVELLGAGKYDLSGGLPEGVKLRLAGPDAPNSVVNMGETDVTLTGKNSVTLTGKMKDAKYALMDTTGALFMDEEAELRLDVNNIVSEVRSAKKAGYYLTRGDLSGLQASAGAVVMDATAAVMRWGITFEQDGALTIQIGILEASNIYQSSEDNKGTSWGVEPGVSVYRSIPGFDAVLVDKTTTLNLSDEAPPAGVSSLVIRNMIGSPGCNLNVVDNKGLYNSKLTLTNSISQDGMALLEAMADGVQIENSLTFSGNLTLNNVGLEVKHENPDKRDSEGAPSAAPMSAYIVEGNLVMVGDRDVELTCGVLELHGEGNDLGRGNVIVRGTEGQLAIVGEQACAMLSGTLEVAPGSGKTEREHLRLADGGTLELRDGAEVGQGVIIGDLDSPAADAIAGTLAVSGNATVAREAMLQNVALRVNDRGTLNLSGIPELTDSLLHSSGGYDLGWNVAGLEGNGKIVTPSSAADMEITATGGDHLFSGDLSAYAGTMSIKTSEHAQIFAGGVKGGTGWSLSNRSGGHLTLDLTDSGNTLTMGKLDLQRDSHTSLLFDLTQMGEGSGLHVTQLSVAQNAHISIGHSKGLITLAGEDGDEVLIAAITVSKPASSSVSESHVVWDLVNIKNAEGIEAVYDKAAGILYLKTKVENVNPYVSFARSANALAGAEILGSVSSAEIGGHLAEVDMAVANLLRGANGKDAANVAQANRIMAAAGGASTAVLGQAVAGDVERQLRTMRNRTTGMSADGAQTSVWLQAEGDYHKMDADGMLPGYKANAWGGTVGASCSVGRGKELGLALTAMYTDLESEGADRLKGDMDTYYVSAYAQVASGAWRHTLVVTVGTASMDADRTVSYTEGSYTTSGSTDGTSFGALYEVGYSIPLRADGAVCLQPIANVALRYSRLDAYTESGSTAALDVDAQKNTALTLGLGARLQAALDGNFWNRTSYFEGRALLKVDCGDREGESKVGFREAGGMRATMRSADRGAVGVELGAGVALPVWRRGEVFVDAGAELWQSYANLNATVGYKVQF